MNYCSMCGAPWVGAHVCATAPTMAERRKQAAMDVAQIQAARITDMETELVKLRVDLAEATKLLREVVDHELAHHESGKSWCALNTDPREACSCGAWSLTERIEAFVEKHPDSQRAQGGGSAGRSD